MNIIRDFNEKVRDRARASGHVITPSGEKKSIAPCKCCEDHVAHMKTVRLGLAEIFEKRRDAARASGDATGAELAAGLLIYQLKMIRSATFAPCPLSRKKP